MNGRTLLNVVGSDFKRSWKELALTDVAYKIIAFILLAPLVGILFRVLMAMSGKSVLADQDILFFFLGPVGWICFVAVGGLWFGIVALEQAALMAILCATSDEKRLGVVAALRFAVATARPVIGVTARLLAFALLTTLPFLAVIGLIYLTFLGQHDINFYLKQKPPEFWIALGLAGVTVAALVALLLRLVTGWFFALPLVLFEDVSAANALRTSRVRTDGHRRTLVFWLVCWALATTCLSTLGSSLVVVVGRFLVPLAVGSLWFLAAAIGATLILWAAVGLVVNLLSTTTFAAMLFHLYRELGGQERLDSSRMRVVETSGSDASGPRFQLTPLRLVVAGVVGSLVAVAVGVAAIRTVHLEDRAQITAHRGASAAAPENTMAAVKRAIEDGAHGVEIDVQETADGAVVVFHDSDFMKLAGKELKIWDATLADLKDIDVGSWFSPEFKNERVPTLGEVLDTCRGKVDVNIELKYYGHDEQLEQRVADIVEAHGMTSEVVLMSLKVDAVKKMKTLRPDWKVGLLMSVSAGNLGSLDVDFLAVNASFANRRFIRSAHDLDREVHVWTVNDAPTMSTMIGRGVDRLITDKPALARSVLEQRARLSPPERLLLEMAGLLGVTPELGEP